MALAQHRESETTILARLFSDQFGQLNPEMGRYILGLDFNDRDKARLHELVVRNQDDALNADEEEEMHAFLNASSMLAILQSRARRTLKVKPEKRTVS